MPRFRLDENRTRPAPDRRLGIKLERPDAKRGLGGKLDAYVPPELRYEYNPPSVFVRYKALTAVFVVLLLGLLGSWLYVMKRPLAPHVPKEDATKPVPPTPQDQPIYIEPLPSK
jgi:hypothetical protein